MIPKTSPDPDTVKVLGEEVQVLGLRLQIRASRGIDGYYQNDLVEIKTALEKIANDLG